MADIKNEVSWSEAADAAIGTVFVDRFEEGVRFIILRGSAALCAYVGVSESHPISGHDYDLIPLQCHGGLTFGQEGDGKYLPSGFWWYGWDYAHCNDRSFYDKDRSPDPSDTEWGVKEVDDDSWSVRYEFQKLVHLAERIARVPQEAARDAR